MISATSVSTVTGSDPFPQLLQGCSDRTHRRRAETFVVPDCSEATAKRARGGLPEDRRRHPIDQRLVDLEDFRDHPRKLIPCHQFFAGNVPNPAFASAGDPDGGCREVFNIGGRRYLVVRNAGAFSS